MTNLTNRDVDNTNILTVCLITYNQVSFVKNALSGIKKQRTNFDYSIVIADDFSTDGTRDLIHNFAYKNQNTTIILQSKNVSYSKNFHDLMLKPDTKYIAYLEGDDYWTDPYKLQKQVDYMENNPNVSCCATRFDIINTNGIIENTSKQFPNKLVKLTEKDTIDANWSPIQTLTLVFKTEVIRPLPGFFYDNRIYAGDWALAIWFSLHGEIHILPDSTAIKRHNSGGVWTSLKDEIKCAKLIDTLNATSDYIPKKYRKLISYRIVHHAEFYLDSNQKTFKDLIRATIYLLSLRCRSWELIKLIIRTVICKLQTKISNCSA